MGILDIVADGCYEDIEKCLPQIDINEVIRGQTPLRVAIKGDTRLTKKPSYCGMLDVVQLLLENGADPNKQTLLEMPIHIAIIEKNRKMVQGLILYGADVNAIRMTKLQRHRGKQMMRYRVPLEMAIDSLKVCVVELLVKKGAIYNKNSLKYIKKVIDEQKDDIMNCYDEKKKYEKLKRIYEILSDNYLAEYEILAKEFIKKLPIRGVYSSYIEFLE